MKSLTKRIIIGAFSVFCSLSLAVGGMLAIPQTAQVEAATALEEEFTNGGQFTISKYNNAVPFEYVDGAAEGLPAGYSGAVLKITTTSGIAYANFDFSAAKIPAANVESVVVRI